MARRGDDEDHCEVDFYLHTYEFRPNFAFHMREAVDKQRNRRRKIQRRLREIEQARKAHEQKENGTSSSDTSGEEQAPPPDATAVQETVEMIAKREELRKREWKRFQEMETTLLNELEEMGQSYILESAQEYFEPLIPILGNLICKYVFRSDIYKYLIPDDF